MQQTLQKVFDLARANLGDTQNNGAGEVFTNSRLQLHFENAWNEMYECLQMHSSPRIMRDFYWVLPALTETFSPQGNGLLDFSEPEFIEERGNSNEVAIVSTDTGTPIKVTATAHGYSTGQEVIQTEIVGTRAPWGRFFITVIDANNYTLNGSASDGLAGSGGIAVTGADDFREVFPGDVTDGEPSATLGTYSWRNGTFNFRGSTTPRQLHIWYSASGVPPTNTSQMLGLDDCQTYLAARTAGLAANSSGFYQMASILNGNALGASGQADGKSGLLHGLLASQIKSLQRQTFRRQPFRSARRYQNQTF